ncbi:hypothetical protein [Rhizobium sp. WYJ-E13]|uniref:hypothetical protein n=1 Tax=unclassified Rhizobium TaxID=2613769 RepID=UPI001C1ED7CA|nr:hypothetical protein [Rhizobium sp. WYJ-E13]QWW69598.1 hypothetical protein KQ933_07810 [Rhizobium sp. WYJ-E13]
MSAITIELSESIREKIEFIATEKGLRSETLLENMAKDLVQQFEAIKLYQEMAERGRGREKEALELLKR